MTYYEIKRLHGFEKNHTRRRGEGDRYQPGLAQRYPKGQGHAGHQGRQGHHPLE